MIQLIKKPVYIGIKVTKEMDDELNNFIAVNEKELGIKIKKTQAIESLVTEGLKSFKSKLTN